MAYAPRSPLSCPARLALETIGGRAVGDCRRYAPHRRARLTPGRRGSGPVLPPGAVGRGRARTRASRRSPRPPSNGGTGRRSAAPARAPDQAATALRDALARAPDYLPAKLTLAEALLEAGNLEEARRRFEALSDPGSAPAVQFGLGTIAAREGRHTDAVGHLERAIALYPEFAAAHYAVARAYRALGRRDDAEAALARHARYGAQWPAVEDPVLASVSAVREDAGALVQRGVKRADAGDIEGAIAARVAAVKLDPSFAQAHANLIGLYRRVRNWRRPARTTEPS